MTRNMVFERAFAWIVPTALEDFMRQVRVLI